jgi:hypothetical protein
MYRMNATQPKFATAQPILTHDRIALYLSVRKKLSGNVTRAAKAHPTRHGTIDQNGTSFGKKFAPRKSNIPERLGIVAIISQGSTMLFT